MRQDIALCGRKMYDMEFPWGLVSNGLLMTDRKIDELLGAGMRSATICSPARPESALPASASTVQSLPAPA